MTHKDMTIKELYELLKKSQEEQTEKLMTEINKHREDQNKKIKKTKEEVKQLQEGYLTLERSRRKNNIIVFGLNTESDNLLEETLNTLNSLLTINVQERDINNIYQIGKHENKRGVLIEFISHLTKKSIFKNISKLKNTRIKVVNDLCLEDRKKKQILVKHLKLAKSRNQIARINGFNLEVDGKKYSIRELENINMESDLGSCNEEESEEEAVVERTEVCIEKNKKDTLRNIKDKSRTKNKKVEQPLNTRLASRSAKT